MKTLLAALTLFLLSIASFAQELQPVVVQNLYQPKPGKAEEVYQWRLHASEVRRKLGLPEGRVLKKVNGEGAWLVAWECDYPSMAAREADVKALDRSDEFTRVQEHMGTLIQKFERNIWEIGKAATSSDETHIRKNRLASNEAIKAHDTTGIARHWTKDVSVVTSRNMHNVGKKQNATAFATEFASRQSLIYIRTPGNIQVSAVAGMAAETGTWVGRWNAGGEAIEVSGSYYAKWIRSGNEWLIRAEVYTLLDCKGGTFCNGL